MSPRAWRVPLQLAVTTVLMVWLWRMTDGSDLLRRLQAAHPGWVAAGLTLLMVQVVVAALRWRYTARQIGAGIEVGTAVREFYLALFLNQVLPGGLGGDAVRAWRHGRRSTAQDGGRMGPAIRAVVIERASGYLALGPGVLAGMALWPTLPGALPGMQIWLPLAGAVVLLAAAVVLVLVLARRQGGGAIGRFLADSRRALLSRRTIGPQLGYTALLLTGLLAVFYCGAHAVGASLSVFHLLVLVPAVILSMSIPISMGGWGLREATAVALWTMAGLPGEEALAASIAYGLLNLLGSLPGALVLLHWQLTSR